MITHDGDKALDFNLEVDREGSGSWTLLRTVNVNKSLIHIFDKKDVGA
jgi:hypothetical protein